MSTGTNRERLEQNNTLLEDIKTQIQNLPEAGGSGDVKLFETQEQMQADPNAKEGDLAIVYRSELKNMTADMEVSSITFPETVTLPTAFTNNAYCRLRAVDSSVMFDGNCQLDQSSFRFDGWSESGMIRAEYTSTDGITYTRTRLQGDSGDLTNPVEVPACKVERAEEWNDNLGYFMQVGGSTFEGLFEYTLNFKDVTKIRLPLLADGEFDNVNKQYNVTKFSVAFDADKIVKLRDKIRKDYGILTDTISGEFNVFAKNGKIVLLAVHNRSGNGSFGLAGDIRYYSTSNKFKIYSSYNSTGDVHEFILDLDNMTYTDTVVGTQNGAGSSPSYFELDYEVQSFTCLLRYGSSWSNNPLANFNAYFQYDTSSTYNATGIGNDYYDVYDAYILIKSQLTLSNPNELLPGKIGYGKNGVVTGDGSIYDNLDSTELLDKPLNSSEFIDNTNARGNIPVLDNRVLYYLKLTENGEYIIGKYIQNEPDVNYVYRNKNISVKCYLNYFVVYNGEDIIYDFRTESDYTDAFRIIPTTQVNNKITFTLRTGNSDGYSKDRIIQVNLETGNVTTLCKRGDLTLEHCNSISDTTGNSYGYLKDSRYAYLHVSKYSSSAPYYVGTRLYIYDAVLDKYGEFIFEKPVERMLSSFGEILSYQTDKSVYLRLSSMGQFNLYRMDKTTGEFILFDERTNYYPLSDHYSYTSLNSLIEDDNYLYAMENTQIKKLSKATMTVENSLTTNLPFDYEYTLDNKLYYTNNHKVHVFTVNISETELTITETDTINVPNIDFDYINNDCVITKPLKNITSEGSANIKMYRCSEANINNYDLAVLGYNLGPDNNQKLHILQNNFYTNTISPIEYNTAITTADEILGDTTE